MGQAGCGRIPNKLEVWKVGMKNAATVNRAKNEAAQARKKAQTKEVAFHLDASIKTTSIESVPTAATTSRTSADTDRRSSKTQELVIDARIGTADIGKFVGVDDDMVDAPSTTDVKGPSNLEESSTSCDPTPAAHLAPEPEVERKKVKLLHEEYEVLLVPASEDEVAIEEEECSTVINEDQYAFDQRPISPPAHVDAMLNMAKHQKQLHNKIKMLEVTELRTVFTYNFSPNTNPNCLQLMLTDAVDVTPARETKINRITRTSLKRGEIIVPQYVYVGLVEGHIYKLIV